MSVCASEVRELGQGVGVSWCINKKKLIRTRDNGKVTKGERY